MKKMLIVTGELSGSNYANEIVKTLRNKLKIYTVSFFETEGAENILNSKELVAFGVFEVITKLPSIYIAMKKINTFLEKEKPDAVLLIDFAGFNLKIARKAKQMGIKTIYFISPKFWAWGEKRAKLISKLIDKMYVIFPFEVELYKKYSMDATYVGNPVVDIARPKMGKDVFFKNFNINPSKPTIAILPGSRPSEIKYMLEPLSKATHILGKSYNFIMPCARNLPFDRIKEKIALMNENVKVIPGEYVYDTLFHSYAGIITSGTASLEATIAELPHIVVYKLNPLTYLLGKRIVKTPFISLPNIIAGKKIVEELIQHRATPENMADALKETIKNRETVIKHLKEVKSKLHPKAIKNLCTHIEIDLKITSPL